MPINNLPFVMIKCLVLTLIIELIVALIIGIRNKKDIFSVILVNIITNPIASSIPILIYYKFGYNGEIIAIAFVEIFAFVFEGFIFSKVLKYKKIDPYLVSLVLNLSSYLIGTFINIF